MQTKPGKKIINNEIAMNYYDALPQATECTLAPFVHCDFCFGKQILDK